MLAFLLFQIIFRRRKRRGPARQEAQAEFMGWPGLDSEFYLLERRLAARGVTRQPSETLAHWLARALTDPGLDDLRTRLRELLRLHYCHRFDPQGLSVPEREALTREANICLEALSQKERHPTTSTRSAN